MKIKSLITLFATAVVALYLNGCSSVTVGGANGAGTYTYSGGNMRGNENAVLDRVWSATQAAMKDLEFTVISQQKDALQARLIARTALDKKIEINLTKISENLTEVKIRVGSFGDQNLSYTIIQGIEKRL